jgi:hypothetical protein
MMLMLFRGTRALSPDETSRMMPQAVNEGSGCRKLIRRGRANGSCAKRPDADKLVSSCRRIGSQHTAFARQHLCSQSSLAPGVCMLSGATRAPRRLQLVGTTVNRKFHTSTCASPSTSHFDGLTPSRTLPATHSSGHRRLRSKQLADWPGHPRGRRAGGSKTREGETKLPQHRDDCSRSHLKSIESLQCSSAACNLHASVTAPREDFELPVACSLALSPACPALPPPLPLFPPLLVSVPLSGRPPRRPVLLWHARSATGENRELAQQTTRRWGCTAPAETGAS